MKKLLAYFDLYARAYRYKTKIDPAEIMLIRKVLKKGNTVVDVGAHKGGYLFWFHKSVGETGKIFAFEPQEELFQYLKNTTQLLNWNNITLEPFGVSNVSGSAVFHRVPDRSSTGASLNPNVFEENKAHIPILITKLDDYFSKKNSSVDFIKVDVESHELEVLEGAQNIIKKDRPMILFEGEKRMSGQEKIQQTFKFLENLGLKGFFFFKGKALPVKDFRFDLHQNENTPGMPNSPEYANNFIFLSRPEHQSLL